MQNLKHILTRPDAPHASKAVKDFIKRKSKPEHIEFLLKFKAQAERKLDDVRAGINELTNKRSDSKLVEKLIMLKSRIVCCTLAIAGLDKMELLKDKIDYLIIDEACQAIEAATLIPFVHNPRHVILVGDQRQLPATTFSDDGARTGFSRSLFERLVQGGLGRTMLEIQYRMHPTLRMWPSRQFYEGRISDHETVLESGPNARILLPELLAFQKALKGRRSLFIDLVASHETLDSVRSKCNYMEAAATAGLLKLLAAAAKKGLKGLAGMIGVISPYKSQVRTLKSKLG